MSTAEHDVFVVVRTAGERTEEACRAIASRQAGEPNVAVVRECPFAEAHLKSMALAADRGARWSVLLDADVLLRDGAIFEMCNEADRSGRFYMRNFRVLDRGWLGPAYAGVHLYRTELLERGLEFAEEARADQKPETRICKEMARLSVPTQLSETLVGLHGYEQWHRDLYRTAYVRAIKYGAHLDYMLPAYRLSYDCHDDFKSMLWGVVDGAAKRMTSDPTALAELDVRTYELPAAVALGHAGVHEKPPLDRSDVETLMTAALESADGWPPYEANRAWICPDRPGFVEALSPRPAARIRRGLRRVARAFRRLLLPIR